MSNDAAGLKGFAQILPRTRNNNNLVMQLAQRQKQNEQEIAAKKGKEDQEWWDKNSKLNFPDVRSKLQEGYTNSVKGAYESMMAINKSAMSSGGLNMESKSRIMEIKKTIETQEALTKSLNSDLDEIFDAYNSDKDKYNPSFISSAMSDAMNNAFKTEKDGSVTFNIEAATSLPQILSDPRGFKGETLVKRFMETLGDQERQILDENGNYDLITTEKYKPLYETKDVTVDGRKTVQLVTDPNTGLPIPKSSPESIRAFDSMGEDNKNWLDHVAKENGLSRKEAFDEFVVKPAKISIKTEKSNKPAHLFTQREKEQNAVDRYQTLRKIVDEHDESALAQGFNMGDRMKVEFSGGGSKGNRPGETKPDQIVVYKREVLQPDPLNPSAVKYSDWTPVEFVPIRDDQQKEVAIFKLNSVLDAALEKSGLSIGNDAIRKVHNQRKSQKPTDLGIDWK